MSVERFRIYSAVYILLIKDDKVLLLRRFNTGWSDGLYTVPSGHIDGNESLTAAAIREAREEAGVQIKSEDLAFLHVMHRKDHAGDKREYLDFFFTAEKWEDEPHNAEPEKCDDAQWYPIDNLPDNILPYVGNIIHAAKTGKAFSEIGWE
jgi:8-oxo-dGTP diphosphatase